MKLEVVTPNGRVLETEASSVTAPGFLGEMGVLPGHRPALVMLSGGVIRYEGPAGAGLVYVRGGIAQVQADAVLVLADEAVRAEAVDRERAKGILDAAEKGFEELDFLEDGDLHRLSADRAYAEALLKA